MVLHAKPKQADGQYYTFFSNYPATSQGKISSAVDSLGTDKHCKGLDSWTHLVSMIFCQFGAKDSLRTICQGLLSATGNLVHWGISKAPSKSALSCNKELRDATLFEMYPGLCGICNPSLVVSA